MPDRPDFSREEAIPACLRKIETGARAILGLGLSDSQLEAFGIYLEMLVRWQRTTRLVGRADPAWIADELILHSLLFVEFLPSSVRSVLDLGSGAGIPGIPIKIANPQVSISLIESRRKRVAFLRAVERSLGFGGIHIVHGRAEDVIGEHTEFRAGFDVVVSRSVGSGAQVIELSRPFLREPGLLVVTGQSEASSVDPMGLWIREERELHGQRRTFLLWRGQARG